MADTVSARDYSADERKAMANDGQAMSDGQFPIADKADLLAAIMSYGRAKNKALVKKHITARAKALKATDQLPADWSGSTKQAADAPATKDDADAAEVVPPTSDYLRRLYSLVKDKVSPDEWSKAVASARGHAGGKATARARRRASDDAEPFVGYYDDYQPDPALSVWTQKYAKDDERVNYRDASEVGVQCNTCTNWLGGVCRIVEGSVAGDDVCDMFMRRASVYAEPAGFAAYSNQDEIEALCDAFFADHDLDGKAAEHKQFRKWLISGEPYNGDMSSMSEPAQFKAGGNVSALISSFGKWAGGSEATCARKLQGKVSDPDKVCAWMKDRYKGSPYWRGKSDAKGAGERVGLDLFMSLPVALAESATPPQWIPYLPKPGSYQHAKWGTISMSDARIERFIANLNAGVYQTPLPLDAEHQTKLSGATAWIHEARRASWGGAEVRVEWTERGKTFWSQGAYKFISPEWWDDWTDPATGTQYADVAIGGALTTRPFFKSQHLMPLVANTAGEWYTADDVPLSGDALPTVITLRPLSAIAARDSRQTLDRPASSSPATERTPPMSGTVNLDPESVSKRFDELESQIADLQAQKQASEAAVTERDTALKAASDRVGALEAEARTRTFTDMVLGRGGAGDGAKPFVGETAKHVAFLTKLAAAFGDDSDEVKEYVAGQRAMAEQIATGKLFAVVGSDGAGGSGDDGTRSATEEMNTRANKLIADAGDGKLTYGDAVTRVASEDPALYSRYRAETSRPG